MRIWANKNASVGSLLLYQKHGSLGGSATGTKAELVNEIMLWVATAALNKENELSALSKQLRLCEYVTIDTDRLPCPNILKLDKPYVHIITW